MVVVVASVVVAAAVVGYDDGADGNDVEETRWW